MEQKACKNRASAANPARAAGRHREAKPAGQGSRGGSILISPAAYQHATPLQWSNLHATRGRPPSTHDYTDRKFYPFTSKEGFFSSEEQMSIFP